MLYLILGNNYINFFNSEHNFLIPGYYTIFKDQLNYFGSYSFLQYILFNQYLRNSSFSNSVSLNGVVIKKIIDNNIWDNERIFFKIINSIFSKDALFSSLVKIDSEYKKDYEEYRIYYPDWELLNYYIKFSQEFFFIKKFDFDNFQTKIIIDIFNYFNKKIKIINSWEYYFRLFKNEIKYNRAYLFFYFGFYSIELFIVSFGNLLYSLTNRYYNVSYKSLLNKLYSYLHQKGIFVKYIDLVKLCNFLLKNIVHIIHNEFDNRVLELMSKDSDNFIKKSLFIHQFKPILFEFYKSLKDMFIDIFTNIDLQVMEDIYDGNFRIISNYEVKDLFLGLLNDIILEIKV
jgi:hypothetical protein